MLSLTMPAMAQPGIQRQLPQWVKDAISPVELAWADVWAHAIATLSIVEIRSVGAMVGTEGTVALAARSGNVRLAPGAVASPVVLKLPPVTNAVAGLPGVMELPTATTGESVTSGDSEAAQRAAFSAPHADLVIPVAQGDLPTQVHVRPPDVGTSVPHPVRVALPDTLTTLAAQVPLTAVSDQAAIAEPVTFPRTAGLRGMIAGMAEVHPAATGDGGLGHLLEVCLSRSPNSQVQPALVDTEVMGVLNGIRSLSTNGSPSEVECREWLQRGSIPSELLARAVDDIPLTYPLDPVYLPMCAVLWKQTDQDVDRCAQLPHRTQLFMGVYLGMIEQEAGAKQLLSSVSTDEQRTTLSLYIAAETLYFAGKAPLTAIWALKRGAKMRERSDEMAWWCMPMAVVFCHWLCDPDLTRQELLPYAEDALASPGSEAKWDMAVPALVEGYLFLGEATEAVARGEHWLSEAVIRKVDTPDLVGRTRLMIGRAHRAAGRPQEAAENFRKACRAVDSDTDVAIEAQTDLLRLARDHSGIGDPFVLNPHFQSVQPERLTFRLRTGEEKKQSLTVMGNLTLRVVKISSTLIGVVAALDSPVAAGSKSSQSIGISVKASDQIGGTDGVITLETNDGEQRIDVPLHIDVRPPIVAQPGEAFFGFIKPGRLQSVDIQLESTVPFSIQAVHANGTGGVKVELRRTGERSYVVQCLVSAPPQTGLVRGTITVATDLACQTELSIPYDGCVATND